MGDDDVLTLCRRLADGWGDGLATSAGRGPANGLLTTAELAARPDFRLGLTLVSPSMRTVRGPSGTAEIEPRVMQVLVVLADAADHVVTRDTLFSRCWGSACVGDDSLNRAIAAVRRIAQDVAAGSFQIETIPRTGYRLTVAGGVDGAGAHDDGSRSTRQPMLTRRTALGSAVAAATIVAGGLGLWSVQSEERRQFGQLMARGEQALDFGDPSAKPAQYFQRAVAMRPDNVSAQALLAFSLALQPENSPPGQSSRVEDAERAARAALAIDPGNAYARLAIILLQRAMLDIATTEDRLRAILRDSPANIHVMRQLWNLLQSAGRSREALRLVERSIELKPLAAGNNFPRAQLLWILGRNAEADRVIGRAMQYWPSHRNVRFARFMIFAFTERPRAALAMLEKPETSPQNFSPAGVSLWRVSLAALEQRSPASIAIARSANLAAAKQNLALASQAVQTLSALGDVDAAFEIANAYLLFRRPVEQRSPTSAQRPRVNSTAWRFAPWLFTPPTASLRADARFKTLCDGIGLTEYWAKRRIKPDYELGFI